jgi:CheY-like chemotaxis protein
VKSRPGEGSVFSVYLTFSPGAVQLPESSFPAVLAKTFTSDKVWVVDDDQLIVDLCEIIFSKNKIDHVCFNSPVTLLNTDWDPAVKYILMDMRMPDISGVVLCEMMREKVAPDVKIFAMTAQVLPEELNAVIQQGFDGVIMKPFRENDLLAIFLSADIVSDDTEPEFEEVHHGDVIYESEESDPLITLDTTVVEKMTFGDPEMLRTILIRFKQDCENDMVDLAKASTARDLSLLRLIVHRIAGRTAQMGSSQMASAFRELEISIAQAVSLDLKLQQSIASLILRLKRLMVVVEGRIA